MVFRLLVGLCLLAVAPASAAGFRSLNVSSGGCVVGNSTIASGIKCHGDIVGAFGDTTTGLFKGFYCHNGAYSRIWVPGPAWAEVIGLNGNGGIVGRYSPGGQSHGWRSPGGGAFPHFDLGANTMLSGINSSGQWIGYTNGRPVMWDGSQSVSGIDAPGNSAPNVGTRYVGIINRAGVAEYSEISLGHALRGSFCETPEPL
jgi:hypothetical protein